jgi:hypothetical protein
VFVTGGNWLISRILRGVAFTQRRLRRYPSHISKYLLCQSLNEEGASFGVLFVIRVDALHIA